MKNQFPSPDYDDILKSAVFSKDSDSYNTPVVIWPVTDSGRSGDFPICRVDLQGDFGTEFLVSIQMDGQDFLSEKIILGDECFVTKVINHPNPESIVGEHTGKCMVRVTDPSGSDLSRSEFSIRFYRFPKHTRQWAHVNFNGLPEKGEGVVRLANLRLRSVGIESKFVISVFISNIKLLSRIVTVPKDGSVHRTLVVDERAYPMGSEHVLRVVVGSEYGTVLSDRSIAIDSDFFSGTGSSLDDIRYSEYSNMTNKPICASCQVSEIVDVHASSDDISVGKVTVRNMSPSEQTVSLHVMFDGDFVFKGIFNIGRGVEVLEIPIPSKILYREDTFKAYLECQVYDSEGFLILDDLNIMTVRSMFDMNLDKIDERTAQFVNPLDPVIKEMVVSADGDLARIMIRDFEVFDIRGYQDMTSPYILMKTAYNTLKEMRMFYVSDTFTLHGPGHYQRVRLPCKVLEDRSGNCMELSILFATIFEVMGLEPVVVFPSGHAVVGVVTSTNMYPTCSMERRYRFHQTPIRFDLDGGLYFEAVYLETTMCSCRDFSFEDAVNSAHKSIKQEMAHSRSRMNFSLVSGHHRNGKSPNIF